MGAARRPARRRGDRGDRGDRLPEAPRLDDEDFKQTLLEFYAAKLYKRLRGEDQLGLAPA